MEKYEKTKKKIHLYSHHPRAKTNYVFNNSLPYF